MSTLRWIAIGLVLLGVSGCTSTETASSYASHAAVNFDLQGPEDQSDEVMNEAEETWTHLLKGMAYDGQTKSLFARLYSGIPIALEVKKDSAHEVLAAPLPEGVSAMIRFADSSAPIVRPLSGGQISCERNIGLARVGNLDLSIVGAKSPDAAAKDAWAATFGAAELAAMRLATEEYLARKLPSWKPPVKGTKPAKSLEERIKAYTDKYKWSLRPTE